MIQREIDRRLAESAYNRGTIKIKINRLKKEGALKNGSCEFCHKDILLESKERMFTLNGSEHKCVGFKKHYLKNASQN